MTAALTVAPSRVGRLARGVLDLAVGGLLCATPVTSVVALGWIARWMAAVHHGAPRPGWVMGPRGAGLVVRLLGGLGANVSAGVRMLAGLAIWTLPFTILWLGAWWAGWENSFNKGYEQAQIGPLVFLAGTILALPLLTLLPYAVAHASAEGRLSGFLDLRRILHLTRGAGWRGVMLAMLSVSAAVPLFGLVALPVFVENIVPGFATLPPTDQAGIADLFQLAAAVYAFAALWFLRHLAARICQRDRPPGRLSPLWLGLSGVVWAGLPVLILVGQFINYAGARWITHPLYLLPWPG